MKKALIFIVLVALSLYGYFKFTYKEDNNFINKFIESTEESTFSIDNYFIFGSHFNMKACIDKVLDNDLSLVLKNDKEEINIDSIFTNEDKTCVTLSDKNNEGIYLDGLDTGKYLLLVKEKSDKTTNYYSFKNNTNYGDLTYYTITRKNKNNQVNIEFNSLNNKKYVVFNITDIKLPDNVYDITIDPGHGGKDSGAIYKLNNTTYKESDITLKVSLLLKEKLEAKGLKVKLTREDDTRVNNYGDSGRAVIPNSVQSKYSLSVHVNSDYGTMSYGGVEVYTPNQINYDFATMLANNISNIVGYSKNPSYKVSDGVYFKYFTKKAIDDFKKELLDDGLEPYNIVEGSPYMFMIREIGGINTHAYMDGRNKDQGVNKYFNSNQTAEPYLIELAYINYKNDLENLLNRPESFAEAISDAIIEYLNIS